MSYQALLLNTPQIVDSTPSAVLELVAVWYTFVIKYCFLEINLTQYACILAN